MAFRKRETLLDPGYVQELDEEVLATRGNVENFLFPNMMVNGQVPNRLVWLRSSSGLLMQVGWLVVADLWITDTPKQLC